MLVILLRQLEWPMSCVSNEKYLHPSWYLDSILCRYSVLAIFLSYIGQNFTPSFYVSDIDEPDRVAGFLQQMFMLEILLRQIYLFWINW